MERQRVINHLHTQGAENLTRRVCEQNGVQITDDQFALLTQFVIFIQNANLSVNLVSRKDMGNIWTRHILHSISLLFRVDIPYGVTVLDLGSGGGFPGIPLSIVREDLKFTLLDSVAKKTSVLERIVSETGLKNVSVLTSRAEELADQPGYKFDVVVARAVAPLSDLIGWCKPLFARRAPIHARAGERLNERRMKLNLPCLLALKGGDLEAETAAARRKEGDHMITTVDLVYVGMGDVGSEEKKLVVVEF